MLRVVVSERGRAPREHVVEGAEVSIGRARDNAITLAKGNISKRHARVVYRDGRLIIVDLKSTNGTYVNGRKLTAPHVFTERDKVYIGDFVLAFEIEDDFERAPTVEVDPTELRLLAAIAQRDEASRLVYADWLEEHGDATRAEFLRVQQELLALDPEDPRWRVASDRMRELAHAIDVHWRYKVARPAIENCLSFEFECPRDWGALATTEHNGIRYCGACAQRVYYCDTVGEAATHAAAGRCVAVDVVNVRRPGDLDPAPRYVTMGMVMPRD